MIVTKIVHVELALEIIEEIKKEYSVFNFSTVISKIEKEIKEKIYLGRINNCIAYEDLLISSSVLNDCFAGIILSELDRCSEKDESDIKINISGNEYDYVTFSFAHYFYGIKESIIEIIKNINIIFDGTKEISYELLEKTVNLYNETNNEDFTLFDFISKENKDEIDFYIENAKVIGY